MLAIFTGIRTTRQLYEALRCELNWESSRPTGGLVHACGFDKMGRLHIVELWESTAALDEFKVKRLLPALRKLQMAVPDLVAYWLSNIDVIPALDEFLRRKRRKTPRN